MTAPLLRAAAAHVFVADLEGCALDAADVHHLGSVLRLRDGETVTASDGAGRYRECAWTRTEGGGALTVVGPVLRAAGPGRGTVAMALIKGDRTDWAVQKLTELGVDRIVLFVADRNVVRWDASRRDRALARYVRIGREAAAQCRRCTLPEILVVDGLDEVRAATPGPLALAEPGGGPLDPGVAGIAVGPEGGWSPRELGLVELRCGLGDTVLRAETAAIVAAVVLRGRGAVGSAAHFGR